MERKVYIANFAGHDYRSAEKFGEIRYITKGYVSFGNLERLKWLVTEALKDSDGRDYLLLSGASSICVISSLVLLMKHSKVNLLVFDRKARNGEGDYNLLVLRRDNLDKLIEVMADGDSNISDSDRVSTRGGNDDSD